MAQSAEAVLALLQPIDRDTLTAQLKSYEAEGVANPKIPLDYDIDGDGRLDAWALDDAGELTLVPVDSVNDTVYVSDGDDIHPVDSEA